MNPKYSVSTTGPLIEAFLQKILASGGFDLAFTVDSGDRTNPDFENPDLVVRFSGPDVDLILGNRAELLLALELVTQDMLRMHSDDHSRISFDANDYRAIRIQELRISALAAAERVKNSGAHFRFNPMNSRERRVIHIALRNEPAVRSESAGFGPHRSVVIYPAGMASLPDEPPPASNFARRPHENSGSRGSAKGGPRPQGRNPGRTSR